MAMDERDQVVRALQAKFVLLKSYYIPAVLYRKTCITLSSYHFSIEIIFFLLQYISRVLNIILEIHKLWICDHCQILIIKVYIIWAKYGIYSHLAVNYTGKSYQEQAPKVFVGNQVGLSIEEAESALEIFDSLNSTILTFLRESINRQKFYIEFQIKINRFT